MTNKMEDERINERIMSGLSESEKLIMKFLEDNSFISNKEAVAVTKQSPAQVRRIFTYLQEKELIVPKGNGRNRHHVLKNQLN